MLRGFQHISGLSVNFLKGRIFGFNVNHKFFNTTSDFLVCSTSMAPFTFLGIPIGCNSRRKSSWDLLLCKIRNRLASWKGMTLSLGGIVTLLNSILASIHLYFFSFY